MVVGSVLKSVAISGNYAIVGSPFHPYDGYNRRRGKVSFLKLQDGVLVDILTSPHVSLDNKFGDEIAMDGNYIIITEPKAADAVGQRNAEVGRVYIFKKDDKYRNME